MQECESCVQLREENARLKDRLEAQFKRLTSMDGLLANAEARIAALEAERDGLQQNCIALATKGIRTIPCDGCAQYICVCGDKP
jgi:chromosome segregation ATPase